MQLLHLYADISDNDDAEFEDSTRQTVESHNDTFARAHSDNMSVSPKQVPYTLSTGNARTRQLLVPTRIQSAASESKLPNDDNTTTSTNATQTIRRTYSNIINDKNDNSNQSNVTVLHARNPNPLASSIQFGDRIRSYTAL